MIKDGAIRVARLKIFGILGISRILNEEERR